MDAPLSRHASANSAARPRRLAGAGAGIGRAAAAGRTVPVTGAGGAAQRRPSDCLQRPPNAGGPPRRMRIPGAGASPTRRAERRRGARPGAERRRGARQGAAGKTHIRAAGGAGG